MKAGKLISRWWWLIVVLLFSFTLIYFIWNTQRQVNALDKELQRPKNAQPNH
jgi:type II secretory pathway component PulF